MRALGPALVGALLASGCAGPLAEECPRGDLDVRYCDRNGDLVADPALRPPVRLDPERLIFAYTPVEDPAQFREVWAGFLAHMERVVEREVLFFPVQSNAAQIEAMRAGRLHVAGFNTGSVPLAVNCAGFIPMTIMASADGSYGYEMELLTHRESGIESVDQIRGHTVAFVAPTSNSGFKAPSVLLESEFGLVANRDFTPAFSGRHDNSVLGVLQRDYDAAAVANTVIDQVLARGVGSRDDLRVLYRSETFPTTAFGVSSRLDVALAREVGEAFFTFEWEGSALDAEFVEDKFIRVTYEEHWEVIRRIDVASGTKLELPLSDAGYALRMRDLVVRYGTGEPVIAGVTLDVALREIVGLIGASGAGKSTLLRSIQRLVEPESGEIFLDSTEITRLPREELRGARRRLGMIFQEHALVARLTVMENVLAGTLGRTGFWRSVRRRFDQDDVAEAFGLLDRVGLTGLEDKRCDALSGGQKQRVGIARALIQHPDVLLVDEPTASLDPATSVRIMSLITEICRERGLAAIINLHNVPLARRFCPRIVGLVNGSIAFDGPPSALDDAVLKRVYGDEAVDTHGTDEVTFGE